jgi:purine-binding chemotaxis protein CheW
VIAEDTTEPNEAVAETPAQILRARAARLAKPMAADAVRGANLHVLTFGLGDEHYAIETRYVLGTLRSAELTPLPLAGEHVLGITSLQGQLLVVFDLRAFFGLTRTAPAETIPLVILGETQPELALCVDSLESVELLAEATLFDPPIAAAAGTRPHVRAVTRSALLLLDGAALLSDPRLYVDET